MGNDQNDGLGCIISTDQRKTNVRRQDNTLVLQNYTTALGCVQVFRQRGSSLVTRLGHVRLAYTLPGVGLASSSKNSLRL